MEDCGNIRSFHSTIMRGNGKLGCNVSFDDVPADHKDVHDERRNTLCAACPDEQDKEHDNVVEECDKIENEELSIHVKSQREFGNLSDNNAHSASMFIMKYQYDK